MPHAFRPPTTPGRFLVRIATLIVLAIAVVSLPGCGGGDVPITGSVLKNGEPFGSSNDDDVLITFNEVDSKRQFPLSYPTLVDATGRFVISGPDNVGIPAGKYKVTIASVSKTPPPPVDAKPSRPGKKKLPDSPAPADNGDRLNNAFSLANTPWTVEVSSSSRHFTFDLEKTK